MDNAKIASVKPRYFVVNDGKGCFLIMDSQKSGWTVENGCSATVDVDVLGDCLCKTIFGEYVYSLKERKVRRLTALFDRAACYGITPEVMGWVSTFNCSGYREDTLRNLKTMKRLKPSPPDDLNEAVDILTALNDEAWAFLHVPIWFSLEECWMIGKVCKEPVAKDELKKVLAALMESGTVKEPPYERAIDHAYAETIIEKLDLLDDEDYADLQYDVWEDVCAPTKERR